MAVLVPAGVGVLTACSVNFALLAQTHAQGLTLVKLKRALREGFPEATLRACAVLGALVFKPVRGLRVVKSARAELRRLMPAPLRFLADAGSIELTGCLLALSFASMIVFTFVARTPVALVVGFAAPAALLSFKGKQRKKAKSVAVETAMPEAFNALSMSLASGHSLAQSMLFVGTHAEEPIKSEFLQVAHSAACGIPIADALDDMLERLDAPGLELVTLALKVSKRTGAPLSGLLSEASSMVGERIELKRRLDVKTSQARMSAHLVAGMPVTMIIVLTLLSSDFRRGLVMPAGIVSIAVALLLNIFAWVAIHRIMKVQL